MIPLGSRCRLAKPLPSLWVQPAPRHQRLTVSPSCEAHCFVRTGERIHALHDDLSVARLRTRAAFGSGLAGPLRVRDAVMTISGRSGGASLESVGLAAAVEALWEHAVSSAASARADGTQAWRLVAIF